VVTGSLIAAIAVIFLIWMGFKIGFMTVIGIAIAGSFLGIVGTLAAVATDVLQAIVQAASAISGG